MSHYYNRIFIVLTTKHIVNVHAKAVAKLVNNQHKVMKCNEVITHYSCICCVFCHLSDLENKSTLQSKLRLPAPSVAADKPHTAVSTKTTSVDDGGNMRSSLLAGTFLVCFITLFYIRIFYACLCLF